MRIPGSASMRAALHAAGGAPRLYRAARTAGAGRLEAGSVLAGSALVLFLVAPRAAGVRGRQNAVRHFVWQALLTARHGLPVARAVADEQERGNGQPLDSATDQHNNAAGQAYGATHTDELAALSMSAALRTLFGAGLAKWEAGELASVSPARAAGSAARRRRRGWRGRARPRKRA